MSELYRPNKTMEKWMKEDETTSVKVAPSFRGKRKVVIAE